MKIFQKIKNLLFKSKYDFMDKKEIKYESPIYHLILQSETKIYNEGLRIIGVMPITIGVQCPTCGEESIRDRFPQQWERKCNECKVKND